jgi:hypothetical protein
MQELFVTILIIVVGSTIAYVITIRKSAFDSPPLMSILSGMPVWPIPTATMASGAMACVPFLIISFVYVRK